MNCFYHEDHTSVATCVDCGKGLCRECTSRYEMPICNECNEKRSRTEKQIIVRQYIPSALFFIGGIVFSIYVMESDVVFAILFGYLMAGVFWGWKVISFIQPKMFLFLPIAGWFFYFIIKFILSYFVGIVAMPIGIAKIIISHVKANAKGKNIDQNKSAM